MAGKIKRNIALRSMSPSIKTEEDVKEAVTVLVKRTHEINKFLARKNLLNHKVSKRKASSPKPRRPSRPNKCKRCFQRKKLL